MRSYAASSESVVDSGGCANIQVWARSASLARSSKSSALKLVVSRHSSSALYRRAKLVLYLVPKSVWLAQIVAFMRPETNLMRWLISHRVFLLCRSLSRSTDLKFGEEWTNYQRFKAAIQQKADHRTKKQVEYGSPRKPKRQRFRFSTSDQVCLTG